jgi:hypothetical protein
VRNGKCWRHYDRIRRGEPNPTAPKDQRKNGLDPFTRLFEAHLRLADVSTAESQDADYERAKDNFRKAAVRYADALRVDAVRKAQQLAWKRGRQRGRPLKKPREPSRWTRWRRRKFAALFAVQPSPGKV